MEYIISPTIREELFNLLIATFMFIPILLLIVYLTWKILKQVFILFFTSIYIPSRGSFSLLSSMNGERDYSKEIHTPVCHFLHRKKKST